MKKCVKCREPIEQKHKIEDCSEGKKPQQVQLIILPKPTNSHVVRASATETVDSDSIPGGVKLKAIKIGIPASLVDVQQLKGQREPSTMCGRQVAA